MKSREIAKLVNDDIESFWQKHMGENRESYVKDLEARGKSPAEIEEFFIKLKQDVQIKAINLFKQTLREIMAEEDQTERPQGPGF